jgi:hypothetical protein
VAFAAGAHAAASLGPDAAEAVPLLLPELRADGRQNPLSFEYPSPAYLYAHMPGKSTSDQLEAVRAVGRIGPAAREALPLLRALVSRKTPGDTDYPALLSREAQIAINAIESK